MSVSAAEYSKNKYSRKAVSNRLSRIEGQIRGVRKMVEEERSCEEVVTQLSAVHSALESAIKMAIINYFDQCVRESQEQCRYGYEDDSLDKVASLLAKTKL